MILLGGCSSAPLRYEKVQGAKWDARSVVLVKKNKKSNLVHMDILAFQAPDRMRLEVTTPMGIHLASMALKNDEFQVALTRQKSYYVGRASAKTLQPIIGAEIDPRVLLSVLFDRVPDFSQGWECIYGEKGYLESCKNEKESISINWKHRELARKVVEIETEKVNLQVSLKGYEPIDNTEASTFEIALPTGFKKKKL